MSIHSVLDQLSSCHLASNIISSIRALQRYCRCIRSTLHLITRMGSWEWQRQRLRPMLQNSMESRQNNYRFSCFSHILTIIREFHLFSYFSFYGYSSLDDDRDHDDRKLCSRCTLAWATFWKDLDAYPSWKRYIQWCTDEDDDGRYVEDHAHWVHRNSTHDDWTRLCRTRNTWI